MGQKVYHFDEKDTGGMAPRTPNRQPFSGPRICGPDKGVRGRPIYLLCLGARIQLWLGRRGLIITGSTAGPAPDTPDTIFLQSLLSEQEKCFVNIDLYT